MRADRAVTPLTAARLRYGSGVSSRRELLLQEAAALFAARGYHAVGVDEIGAAAGITGPGVYRHFAGKAALLRALTDRAVTEMTQAAVAVRDSVADPYDALVALVDRHVDFAVDQRALLGVWARESRSLPEAELRPLLRQQRAYEQPWRDVLAALRPDLQAAEVSVAVTTTLALLNGTAYVDPTVPPEALRRLLRRMALAALLSRQVPPRPRGTRVTG